MRFSDVNYNLYKVFIAVYENKNMTRAARELFIGQPNVSRSIKELEKNLGIKLFYPSPRGVEPTREGTALYHKVMPALAWIDYGEKSIKGFDENSAGTIKIAIATNFAGYYIAKSISSFNKKYPRIKFDVIHKSVEETFELLERNRVNLAFSTLPLNDNKVEFEKLVLKNIKEAFFASKNFASKNGIGQIIEREDFEKLPYILIRVQEPLTKPLVTVDSQEMLFQLVANDVGVGSCLEDFLDFKNTNDICFKFSIKGYDSPQRAFTCLYNKDYLDKATEVFLTELERIVIK